MKRLGLVSLVALLGLMLTPGSARAYTLSVNVPQNSPSPASGSYTVVLNSADNRNFTFSAFGNNDGNGSPGNPSGTPAKHSAGTMTISFLDGSSAFVPPTSASAATTTGGGFTGANWISIVGDSLVLQSPSQLNDLSPFGGNQLNGSFVLTSAQAVRFNIAMQDGSQQWFAPNNTIPNTPEPASLAMVLPGILPLGFIMVRRRKKSETDASDDEPLMG